MKNNSLNLDSLIRKIAEHYGFAKQSNQTIEECAELIQSLTKYNRTLGAGYDTPVTTSDTRNHIIEELADVQVCTAQLIYLLECEETVYEIMLAKMNRQLGRIGGAVSHESTP